MSRKVVAKIGEEIHTNHFDYTFLALVAGITLASLFYFQNQKSLQLGILTIFGIFYVLWGAIHHLKDQSFHLKVLLEYILISIAIILLAHNLL